MTVKAQKPIVIFRGDNTAAFDLRTIRILLTGDLDLSHATAKFTLLDFSKTWTEQEVATGELSIVFTAEQTKAFALGPQTGTLRLYDMSTGTPRQLTIVNKIPFFVTNRVCEIDSQSYETDVCVSGGDVIHIEFNVGASAVEGKADKVKNATAGDLASLTADGNLEDSGIPKTDVLRKTQMDSAPTEGSSNPVTSDGIKQAIDAATPIDYAQVKAQVAANTGDIAEIESLIPAQASDQNKLADRNFVNSSIQTNTATFRGSYNLVSDLGLTVSATEQQVAAAIAAKLASLVPQVVPENNDYVFVQVPKTDTDPTVIERVDRYKCTVTESGGVTTRVWEYEWSLNNSSFTADQWAAINSGITNGAVAKLGALPTAQELTAALLAKTTRTELFPSWAANTEYTIYSLVIHESAIYKCQTAHTSSAEWDSTKWGLASGADVLGVLVNYLALANKPQINGHTMAGNQTGAALGLLGNSGDQTLNGGVLLIDNDGPNTTLRLIGIQGDVRIENWGGEFKADASQQNPNATWHWPYLGLPNELARISNLPYAIHAATVSSGTTPTVTDILARATNTATLGSTVTAATVTLPAATTGKMRDFFISLTVEGSTAPSLTFIDPATNTDAVIAVGEDSLANIDTGLNIVLFSEAAGQNRWIVSVKHEEAAS